ncbi:MAG: hypothetical protein JWM80_5112 [Cyanobacteria bacterium RYN_339]|nr:hypothetical protein [Cyanobacteria bacterium RYN_339]
MQPVSRRLLVLTLPVVIASGCFGTGSPTSTTRLRTKPVASTAVGVVATNPVAPASSVTSLKKTSSPSPKPSATTPVAAASQAPMPSPMPSFPAIAAQAVTVNPPDGVAAGLALQAQSFLVLSAANIPEKTAVRVGAADNGGTPATAKPVLYHALSAQEPDAHAAWRRWQATQALPAKAPRYGLQATATPLQKGASVPFYVITSFDNDQYADVQISARVAEVGQHCYVLIDKDADKIAAEGATLSQRAKEIAAAFDAQIYPTDTRTFGAEPNPGVDGDARLFILLSPAVGNYGKDNTLGFFAQRDEFAARADAQPIYKHSNAKEMFYVSSRIVLKGSADDYMGTIAHEFQHMINFNQKVLVPWQKDPKNDPHSEDLWIDEGMAMYAIEANGYGLKSGGQVLANHVKKFQQEPEQYSLTEWTGNPDDSGYGPVYLFMVYLADRFGEDIIHTIVSSAASGTANLDAVLRPKATAFNRVFHDWALANAVDPLDAATDPAQKYASLKMVGSNGSTRLIGFASRKELRTLPGVVTLNLRPYSLQLFDLPTGPVVPRFTLDTTAQAGSVPRLILPP